MSQQKSAHIMNIQSHFKNASKEQKKTVDQLANAIGAGQDILFRMDTVFPFQLFTTTVSVDRAKITITDRDFIKSGEVLSIRIEDVLNITSHVGPFLGSVKIVTRFFNPEKPYIVKNIKRSDALQFKRIVIGCLIARQKEIDYSSLPTKELAEMLNQLGMVDTREKV